MRSNGGSVLSSDVKESSKFNGSPSQEEIEEAIRKLKGRDVIGRVGDALSSVTGVIAGAASAGTLAGLAGASTILGSTTLAGVLGGVFVTTTPAGWIVGTAALAGVAGYGIAKVVRSGERQDGIRTRLRSRLSRRLTPEMDTAVQDESWLRLQESLASAVEKQLITSAKADQLLALVDRGALPPEQAVKRLDALLQASVVR